MTTYTGKTNAFITSSYKTLATLRESKNPVAELVYAGEQMIGYEGWIHVGTAEISVTLLDESKVLQGMVESIDKQIQNTYAEAESKINILKEKKQQLLAITMELT